MKLLGRRNGIPLVYGGIRRGDSDRYPLDLDGGGERVSAYVCRCPEPWLLH